MVYLEKFNTKVEAKREIFEYITRDMTSPEGAFHSAEDADSEDEEGKFYIWNLDEFVQILDKDELAVFKQLYNISEEGNFETSL